MKKLFLILIAACASVPLRAEGEIQALNAIITNIQTLIGQIDQLPRVFGELQKNINELNPRFKCLKNPGQGTCNALACTSRDTCAGAILGDTVKALKPSLQFLGEVAKRDTAGKPIEFRLGLITAVIDTLLNIPRLVPTQDLSQSVKSRLGQYNEILTKVKSELQDFAVKFDDILGLLGSLGFILNPNRPLSVPNPVPVPAVTIAPAPADDFVIEEVK